MVIDNGAFKSTPTSTDFIRPISPMDKRIQSLSATTRVKGIGAVRWNIRDNLGKSTSFDQLLNVFQKQISDS